LRPSQPPNVATINLATHRLGGSGGGAAHWVVKATSAFHSCSSKYTVQGTAGVSRPNLVK